MDSYLLEPLKLNSVDDDKELRENYTGSNTKRFIESNALLSGDSVSALRRKERKSFSIKFYGSNLSSPLAHLNA